MPLYDWSAVDHGLFHDFQKTWLGRIAAALNDAVLPHGCVATVDQPHIWSPSDSVPSYNALEPVTEVRVVADPRPSLPQRWITIRQSKGQRVAVILLVSPADKNRRESVGIFAGKVRDMLDAGVHVLVIDVLPPNRWAPRGMHAAIWSMVENRRSKARVPVDRPMLVASYRSQWNPIGYINYTTVGRTLPPGPLYLDDTRFVAVPLDATYRETYNRLPKELKAELPR